MSANQIFECGAVALGYVGIVASWRRPTTEQYVNRYPPMVVIQQCSGAEDGVYEPAASVTVNGRDGLIALRAAIDKALNEGEAT